MSADRLKGEVVSYGDDRGFGFIRGDDDAEYFVRFNEIQMDGYRTLEPGQRVSFTVMVGTQGWQASDVRVAPDA